jgi:hypothetical protein
VTRPRADRQQAAALILSFLACVGDARIERMVRYMETSPLRFPPGTTRNTVVRLARQGRIVRCGYARYQLPEASAPPAQLE